MMHDQELFVQLQEWIAKTLADSRWFVYMVMTSRGHFYTGISTCPEVRVTEHNNGKKGAKCLRGQRPVTLVWRIPRPELKSVALKLERRIKKLSHRQKQEIVDLYTAGKVFVFPDGQRLW